MTRARVQVRGRVQGVFFRAEARARAESLGVAGWIRNLPDGRVEAVFEGPPDDVLTMVNWASVGPPRAEVRDIDIAVEEPTGESGFRVR